MISENSNFRTSGSNSSGSSGYGGKLPSTSQKDIKYVKNFSCSQFCPRRFTFLPFFFRLSFFLAWKSSTIFVWIPFICCFFSTKLLQQNHWRQCNNNIGNKCCRLGLFTKQQSIIKQVSYFFFHEILVIEYKHKNIE